MAQWDNRLQNSSFGRGKPLFSVIFEALDQVQPGLTIGSITALSDSIQAPPLKYWIPLISQFNQMHFT